MTDKSQMIFIRRTGFFLVVLLGLGQWSSSSIAQSDEEPPRFTAAQAANGGKTYEQHCAACHGANLEGVGIVPALSGTRFDQTWRGKSTGVLAFHIRRMPPRGNAEAGGLGDESYTNILAYLLDFNDFEPGDIVLPGDLAALSDLTIPRLEGVAYDPVVPVVKTAAQTEMLRNLPDLTAEMLRNPSPSDWLHWGRTYNGRSYSPLNQINKKNVAGLRPAWRTPLLHGSSMPMPLVHRGVMFLHTFPDTVIAMDATNGQVLWRYRREGLSQSNKKMGLSLHEGRIYFATSDLHVVALSAKTGELVWDHRMDLEQSSNDRRPIFARSAPLIAGDVVIQGIMSFRVAKGSYIIAIDRKTGKEAWRFNTVAWPGQPGGNTWNGLPVEQRNGGSVWQQGTYDPELNLVYYGVAPTYDTAPLLVPADRADVTNNAMYTNCTVALNADTGELVWYFQHTQNDQWDMDWVFERTIAELPTQDGGTVKAVMNVGKNAMLDALDAATGEFLFSVDTGVQNVITAVDPETGAKSIDPSKMPNPDTAFDVCPIPFGARSWPQTSYSPDTKYVYVPITESCFRMSETGKGGWLLTTGVEFGAAPQPDLEDGMMGRVQAIDVANRKLAWNTDQLTPPSTGILSTAGGLVFSGDIAPSLKAFDDASGKLLWETPLDDAPSSSLITYQVGDTQYIAVVVGMTNNHVRDITRHYRQWSSTQGTPGDTGGASVWVFAWQ
ncbi:MAG: PQQ-binding-like beta-propeller repeat protein [Gammaproteobacteria bacterium]|nr:PQQ-binding-like beta-propeller repeat protein [Gammaproteobacteria bacterium]